MLQEDDEKKEGFFKDYHQKVSQQLTDEVLKNFGEMKTNEDRFAFCYKLPYVHEIDVQPYYRRKSAERAIKKREEGNKAFVGKKDYEALSLYSQSVIMAPVDPKTHKGKELSLSLANRSAVLFHLKEYHLALVDIDLALESGYPWQLQYKLYDRRGKCALHLKQYQDSKEAFQKALSSVKVSNLRDEKIKDWELDIKRSLSVFQMAATLQNAPYTNKYASPALPEISKGRNPQFPSASSAVDIQYLPEKGRFATAATDITVGDVLLVEKAYASVLLPQKFAFNCIHCFKVVHVPIPCPTCSGVTFCSPVCREAALSTYHQYECPLLQLLEASGMSITCYLSLRTIAQSSLNFFLQMRSQLSSYDARKLSTDDLGKVYDSHDYLAFYNLVKHTERRTTEAFFHRTLMAVFLLKCLQQTTYFSQVSKPNEGDLSEEELFIGGLLLHHLEVLQFNSHEVAEFQMTQRGQADDAKSVFIGGACYPTLALFNHSCEPSIVRYYNGDTVVVHSIKNIKKGEQISENYGPVFTSNPREARQRRLQNQYWFQCNCSACVENWPQYKDMANDILRYKCSNENCKSVLLVSNNTTEAIMTCQNCGTLTNILGGLMALEETEKIYNTGMELLKNMDLKNAIEVFQENLNKLDKVLCPPYRDYHLTQEAIWKCIWLLSGNNRVRPAQETTESQEMLQQLPPFQELKI